MYYMSLQNPSLEQDITNTNIKIHYYDFGYINRISYTKDGEQKDLFPIQIEEDQSHEYTPEIPINLQFDKLTFKDIESEILNALDDNEQLFDIELIHFLKENIDEEEYLRFMFEQFVAKKYFDAEKKEGDRYSLIFKWNEYYPSKRGLSIYQEYLPTCTETLRNIYATNKLYTILTNPDKYDFTESYFNEKELQVLLINTISYLFMTDPYYDEEYSKRHNEQHSRNMLTSKLFKKHFEKWNLKDTNMIDDIEHLLFDYILASRNIITYKKEENDSTLSFLKVIQKRAGILSRA